MDRIGSADIVVLDRFRFEPRSCALFHLDGGAPVAVGSRALEVLAILIEQAGDLVPKHAIMSAVWSGTTVEDNNLTVQISALRRILDAQGTQGSCIQTVSGRGYRFVGSVARQLDPNLPATPVTAPCEPVNNEILEESLSFAAAPQTTAVQAVPAQQSRRLGVITGILFAACCLLAAGSGSFWQSENSLLAGRATPAPHLSIVVLPFTNLGDDREQQYFADAVDRRSYP